MEKVIKTCVKAEENFTSDRTLKCCKFSFQHLAGNKKRSPTTTMPNNNINKQKLTKRSHRNSNLFGKRYFNDGLERIVFFTAHRTLSPEIACFERILLADSRE
ncbi:CLUMA_CG015953, isoform A [Clunio marinus]|uniref:CLUMA_CG015953, isoform A n=1 Tax=Clunio marinus TaxID=568069 RepID=A0A1J1ISZ0_9DIPT|nr:CLUMA_CG015953, isoform A [Clunio marinus]